MSEHSYAGPPADPAGATPPSGLSRRSALLGAAAAGAAGLAAVTLAGTGAPALAAATRATPAARHDTTRDDATSTPDSGASEPVIVHVRDARSGELDIFSGTSHTRLHDPDLAARLSRAAR
jgi:hypothetical protein